MAMEKFDPRITAAAMKVLSRDIYTPNDQYLSKIVDLKRPTPGVKIPAMGSLPVSIVMREVDAMMERHHKLDRAKHKAFDATSKFGSVTNPTNGLQAPEGGEGGQECPQAPNVP